MRVCVRTVERDIIDELITDMRVYDGTGRHGAFPYTRVYRANIKNNDSSSEPCERYNS